MPEGYKTWFEAIDAFVRARGDNETPDTVESKVWNVFETVATKLVPKVSV